MRHRVDAGRGVDEFAASARGRIRSRRHGGRCRRSPVPACSSQGTVVLGFGPMATPQDSDVLKALRDERATRWHPATRLTVRPPETTHSAIDTTASGFMRRTNGVCSSPPAGRVTLDFEMDQRGVGVERRPLELRPPERRPLDVVVRERPCDWPCGLPGVFGEPGRAGPASRELVCWRPLPDLFGRRCAAGEASAAR